MSHFFLKKTLIKTLDGFFLLLIIFSFFFNPKIVSAATYTWNQTDWSDGLDNGTFPNHTSNQTNWTKYFSKDSDVKSETGLMTLSPISASSSQTSDTDFSSGTISGVSISGTESSGSITIASREMSGTLSLGNFHTCSVKSNGTVFCWGDNRYGQLGIGTTARSLYPVQVLGAGGTDVLTEVEKIVANEYSTCALKSNGTVFCWGNNAEGQIGINNTTFQKSPVQVLGAGGTDVLTEVESISGGEKHNCAVKTNGTAFCWGLNSSGQIGNNSSGTNALYPVQVAGAGGTGVSSSVSQIAAGARHSCLVKTDGTVFCWGNNSSGQIGNNTSGATNILFPTQVIGAGATGVLTDVESIDTGWDHSCIKKTNGTAFCWGDNWQGQLGSGDNVTPKTYPIQVLDVGGTGNISGIKEITAGNGSSCALKTNGTLFCWGYNPSGRLLGVANTISPRTYPFQILGLGGTGDITNINTVKKAWGTFNCFEKNTGTLFCWGSNDQGQLGYNGTDSKYDPIQVVGLGGTGILSLGAYMSSGNFISSAIDLGQNSNLINLGFTTTTPDNTSIKFQLRGANSLDNLNSATWYGPTGISDYYTSTGTTINSEIATSKRYIQYKAILETNDDSITPRLDDVTINHQYYQSGSFISSPYDTVSESNLLSKIQWIKSTPDDTAVKFQIRTANNSTNIASADWKGPDGTSETYFTDNLGGETMPSSVRDGVNDQWIQYKAFLETNDSSTTPLIYDVTTTYVVNAPPSFDSIYETNGFGITAGTVGTFNFLYSVGDTDTDQGSEANRYKLWPTFEYTIDNGSTWTTIADENLTGPNSSNPITLISPSNYVIDITTWNAAADLPNSYNTVKIRMVIDDHEAANNTSTITSDAFVVDTKAPEAGTPDGGGTGININRNVTTSLAADKTNSRNVTLYFSATDDSAIQFKYSTDPNFTGASYQDYVSSIGYTLPIGDGSKRVYVKFKDYYGNETESYSDVIELDTTSPSKPSSLFIQDVSNTSINESRLFLNWGKSSDSDWLGYKIYRSIDGTTYDLQQTINNINTNYIVDTGVTIATNYFYKVTAIDDLTNESVGSSISQTVGGNPSDAVSPIISNIQVSNKTTSSITITWTTNEVSNSTVLYSTDSDYDSNQGSSGYSLTHSVTLSGLTPGTTYNFKVRSSDPSGNATDSNADNFTTNAADIIGPEISNIGSTSITDNSAVIVFNTNESATSFIEYSITSGFSSGNIVGNNSLRTSHFVKLTSLSPSTTYYYKVRSSDINGNETVSTEKTLVTLDDSNDSTAPTISSVSVHNIAYNTANIRFITNEFEFLSVFQEIIILSTPGSTVILLADIDGEETILGLIEFIVSIKSSSESEVSGIIFKTFLTNSVVPFLILSRIVVSLGSIVTVVVSPTEVVAIP